MRPRSLFPAFLLGLLAFLAYRLTAAPAVLPGDAGEFQFTVPLAGVSHATGYPLYHVLGWAWSWLYRRNPAQGVNHFSALWGGVAVALFYLLAYEALKQLTVHLRWRSRAGLVAAVATLIFAGNPTLWAQATQAEVYTLQAALVAGLLGAALAVGGRETRPDTRPPRPLTIGATVALLLGLGLTHHLSILLFLPGLLVYLFLVRPDIFAPRNLLRLAPFLFLPLLLYLYIPLRLPASPWLKLSLAPGQTLDLFDNSVGGILRFTLGLGFAPALRGPAAAIAQIPVAAQNLFLHFGWVGLALIALGLIALILEDQLPALLLTGVSFLCLTIFNLFYGIQDIAAYYIPPYLIATLWLGLGLAYAVDLLTRVINPKARPYLLPLTLAALAIPYFHFQTHRSEFDRSDAYATTFRWQEILTLGFSQGKLPGELPGKLPADAILISNDRDEITPLLYFQHVLGQAPHLTGLFPLIHPSPAWADLNTTLATATASGRPVYTIKPMPGVEALYRMEILAADVSRIEGPHPAPEPSFESPYGDYLRWLNTTWSGDTRPGGDLHVELFWRIVQTPPLPWHSFLHLLDPDGNKIAQADDHRPGGNYLPAPLWRPGDVVNDTFVLPLPADLPPGNYTLVTGFYDPTTGAALTSPLAIAIVQSP